MPNRPVEHSRAQRAYDTNSKDDLNDLSEMEIQSDLDIKETQTRNDSGNTPSKLSALKIVDENEDSDIPVISLCPSNASERTRYEYKVRADTIALQYKQKELDRCKAELIEKSIFLALSQGREGQSYNYTADDNRGFTFINIQFEKRRSVPQP